KVGLIYNAGEANSVAQIEAVQEAAEGTSVELSERTVSNSSEVQQAASTLAGDVDLFYIVTDNTVVYAVDVVVAEANEQQIALIAGSLQPLALGVVAPFGIKYHTIGSYPGDMASEILTGEKTPAELPVE